MNDFTILNGQDANFTLESAEGLFWLLTRADEEPILADDNDPLTDEWTDTDRDAFFILVASHGYAYPPDPGGGVIAGGAGGPGGGVAAAGWRGTPPVRTAIQLPAELRNRGLVAKALKYLIEGAVKGNLAYSEGAIFGLWDGAKGDVEGVVDVLRLSVGGWDDTYLFIHRYIKDPYRAAGELHAIFGVVKQLTWSGVKQNITAMVDEMMKEFTGNQKDRLKLVLGDECEDPIYLTTYLAGYTAGFIGEQVAVTFFTAGLAKAGVVAKVLQKGRGAVATLLEKAAAKFPAIVNLANGQIVKTGIHLQNTSKGFYGEFVTATKSADQARATRRIASRCMGPGGCLAAGTLVAMADGSYRRIENVHTGDSVLAMDGSSEALARPQIVKGQVRTSALRTFRLTWDSNDDQIPDGTVTATPEHPFWTHENGWTIAQDLKPGMRLVGTGGKYSRLLETSEEKTSTTTYNLDVDGPDSFFVASEEGNSVLVHNNDRDTYPYNGFADEGIERGLSPQVRKPNDVWIERLDLPLQTNPQHHFYGDAWLKQHWTPDYRSRSDPFPCIELTNLQHAHLEDAMQHWFKDNLGFQTSIGKPRYPLGAEWKTVKISDMRKAAKHAASTIGLPDKTVHQLSAMSLAYIRKHLFHHGCM